MARKRRVVRIPRPPKDAFNKDRPAGTLLQTQTAHLRHALARHLQKIARHLDRVAALLAVDIAQIKTEGQVSEYAKRATAILHAQGSKQTRSASGAGV